MRLPAFLVGLVFAGATQLACGHAVPVHPGPPQAAAHLGAALCNPPSPQGDFSEERQGTAINGSLWAYLMPKGGLPVRAGEETKIVWRYTIPHPYRDPNIRFSAHATDGASAQMTFGPEGHGGSTWVRPGYEVGTGFIFPEPGCWDIHAIADRMSGDLFLVVE